MYLATARDYYGGGDSSCTRSETTTTIGFWTRRIGIGAAGRTLTQRNSWYRTDWAVVGTMCSVCVCGGGSGGGGGGGGAGAALLARSLTRRLAGGPAGNTAPPPPTSRPPPPRAYNGWIVPNPGPPAVRPHSWTRSVGDSQTYNYRIARPAGFKKIHFFFFHLPLFRPFVFSPDDDDDDTTILLLLINTNSLLCGGSSTYYYWFYDRRIRQYLPIRNDRTVSLILKRRRFVLHTGNTILFSGVVWKSTRVLLNRYPNVI